MPVRKVIELAAGAQIRAIDCKRISLISGFLIPGIHCSKKNCVNEVLKGLHGSIQDTTELPLPLFFKSKKLSLFAREAIL